MYFFRFIIILGSILYMITAQQSVIEASSWETIEIKHKDQREETMQIDKSTKELLRSTTEVIDNPSFITLLNESTFSNRMLSFGTHASIYLGRWPLTYDITTNSTVDDYYEAGKVFVHNNKIQHEQLQTIQVEGALHKKIEQGEDVKEFIQDVITTDQEIAVNFSVTHHGKLEIVNKQLSDGVYELAIPAVYTTGNIRYGDVYIEVKGKKKQLVVKDILNESIGAWIPMEEYIAYKK